MPNLRGWAALGAAAALLLLWTAFGEDLLLALAAFLVTAVLAGTLYVRLTVPNLTLTRSINPDQLHDGEQATVELLLVSRRNMHRVRIEDRVHGLGSATFITHRVASGETMVAHYEIVCRPRGIYRVGPARVSITDPLGFAEAARNAGGVDRLVVHPKVETLTGAPTGPGQNQTISAARSSLWHTSGEDFFALREYQQGDDLRKVHWPSSARHDKLIIKQLEMPWQSRACIVLDPRVQPHISAQSFEHAVSGTASVLRHLFQSGYTPTIWTGSGTVTHVDDASTYLVAMEKLATITPQRSLDLHQLAGTLRRGGATGGILILITGEPDRDDVEKLQLLSKDFSRTVVLSVESGESDAILGFARVGTLVIRTTPEDGWASHWRNTTERGWSTVSVG